VSATSPPQPPSLPGPQRRWLRPAVHAAMGLNALWLGVLPRWGGVALALAAFALNALVLPRLAIGRALTRPGERFWGGLRTYPLAVLGLVLLLPAAEAAAAWGVLAFGDAAAAVVGQAVPAPRLFGHRKATWSGTPAFVVCGALAAWLLGEGVARLATSAPWVEPGVAPSLLRAGAAAAVAALVDLVRIPPDDNLPCAAASGATLHVLRGLV
jgi:dolichol kinase